MTLRPRPEVDALPAYVPGRSAQAAMDEHELTSAIKLASNESSFGPLPAAAKAIEDAVESVTRYPDSRAASLRAALAEHLGVAPANIAVGTGSVGLIQQLCLAYAGPGDEIVFGDPSFEAYPVFAQLSGASAVPVPLRRQTIDAVAMSAAVTPATRLVLLASPNNPTGTALRTAELLALADAIPDSCLLVVDEAYHEFADGADVPDAVNLLGDRENVVVLRTFSKAYGLAALRVGYMAGAAEVIATVNKVALPFGVNAIGQVAAQASLKDPMEVRHVAAAVNSIRGYLVRELAKRGFITPDPQGNFVWLPAGAAAKQLGDALERKGVVTRAFAGRGVRVTVGSLDETQQFLAALDRVAAELDIGADWALPSGEMGRAVGHWLQRLGGCEIRLRQHAHESTFDGLTEPDPGGDERWEAAQVWGHIGEFGDYWLVELDRVLDGEPNQPFGRTKADEGRRAAIAAGPGRSVDDHLEAALRSLDRLRARLSELTTEEWSKVGTHPTLGRMTISDQLTHFHIGHYEEHLAQLDELAANK